MGPPASSAYDAPTSFVLVYTVVPGELFGDALTEAQRDGADVCEKSAF
jgi:hypothetical protein